MTVKFLGTAEDLAGAKGDMRRLPFNRWFYVAEAYPEQAVNDTDVYIGLLVHRIEHMGGDDTLSVRMGDESGVRWSWMWHYELSVTDPLDCS